MHMVLPNKMPSKAGREDPLAFREIKELLKSLELAPVVG